MLDFWKIILRASDGEGAGAGAGDTGGSAGSDPGGSSAPTTGGSDTSAPGPSIGDASGSATTGSGSGKPDPEANRLAILDAAFERGMKRHRENKGIPEPVDETANDETTDGAGSDVHPTDPRRRKDGTFRSEQDPAQKAGVDPASEDGAVDPAATKPQQPQAPVVPVPAAWSREMHDEFSRASPAVQRYVAQREEQISEGFKRLGPFARFGNEVAEIADTHRDYFEARPNLKITQVLDNYLNFDRLVASNPAAAVMQLAAIGNVDLADLVDAISQNRLNPREAILQHQLETERTNTAARQRRAEEMSRWDEEAQREEEELRQTYAFNQAKDQYRLTIEKVAVTLPDFDDLEGDILALLPQVIDANPGKSVEEYLKEAHGRARRANPKTFAKMQAEARKASAARRTDAVKRADAARNATRSNVTSSGVPASQTLRQAQDAAFERGMARHNARR